MFLDFYRLREQPFGVTPDSRFVFDTPSYREAWASLWYGIEARRGFMAVIAEPGMGKTTLIFRLLEELRGRTRTAFLFQTQRDSQELLRSVLVELGCDIDHSDTRRMHETLKQILVQESRAGTPPPIVMIDEAQNLDNTVLETVRLLSNFETPRDKLLQIVLAGQPELAERLSTPQLAQLRQRISILCRLDSLSAEEVRQYIDHRLRVAGYAGEPLFTPQAYSMITALSGGIPRNINNICFSALSLACALQRRQVDDSVLNEVSTDLDVRRPKRRLNEIALAPPTAVESPSPVDAASVAAGGDVNSEYPEQDNVEPVAAGTLGATLDSLRQAYMYCRQRKPWLSRINLRVPRVRTRATAWVVGMLLILALALASRHEIAFVAAKPRLLDTDAELTGAAQSQSIAKQSSIPGPTAPTRRTRSRVRDRRSAAVVRLASPPAGQDVASAVAGSRPSPTTIGQGPGESDPKAGGPTLEVASANRLLASIIAANTPQSLPKLEVTPLSIGFIEGKRIRMVEPKYPPAAALRHLEGQVVLAAAIGSDGRVRDVRVVSGAEPLADAAIEAVKAWRYEPSYLDGKPVVSERQITINFKWK